MNTILSPLLLHNLNKKPTFINKDDLKSKHTVESPSHKRRSEISKSVIGSKGFCKRRKQIISNNYSYHLDSITSPKSKKFFRPKVGKIVSKLPLLHGKSNKKNKKSKSKSKKSRTTTRTTIGKPMTEIYQRNIATPSIRRSFEFALNNSKLKFKTALGV